jgi:hypothetical protein
VVASVGKVHAGAVGGVMVTLPISSRAAIDASVDRAQDAVSRYKRQAPMVSAVAYASYEWLVPKNVIALPKEGVAHDVYLPPGFSVRSARTVT